MKGAKKNYSSIPKIILQGQWLGNLGFSIGDKVAVSYQRDKVIIERYTDGQAIVSSLEKLKQYETMVPAVNSQK